VISHWLEINSGMDWELFLNPFPWSKHICVAKK
jgi:hypothetical protein